jgi:dihydroneopterin aldolase
MRTIPEPRSDALQTDTPSDWRVFVRDLVLPARIGVHSHERNGPQRIRINVELAVSADGQPIADSLANVVCYEDIVEGIRAIIARGHVNLVETLAAEVLELCLDDRRVTMATVRVEKLHAIPDAASVGVELRRERGR